MACCCCTTPEDNEELSGILAEGYQNALRDFLYYLRKLRENLLPTGLVKCYLPLHWKRVRPIYADFHRRPSLFCWRIGTDIGLGIRLLVLIGELSFGWSGLFRLVGGFLRVSPKGLTRRPLVRVFGPRGCDGIQRWLVREREREIKFIGLFGNRGHRGAYSPYKPLNHNLYIGIIIFPHIDNPQSTGYN